MARIKFSVGDKVKNLKSDRVRTISEISPCGGFFRYEGRDRCGWQPFAKFELVKRASKRVNTGQRLLFDEATA